MMISTAVRKKLSPIFAAFALSGGVLAGIVLTVPFAKAQISRSADPPATTRAQSDDSTEEEEVDEDDAELEQKRDRFRERIAARKREREEAKKKAKESSYSKWLPVPGDSSDGPGIISQGGFLADKTFGRTQSIAPLEALPYILTDEHFFFGDVRGFVSTSSTFGGNAGLGYRYLRDDLRSWFGISGWFDDDGTTGKYYQQVGASFEAMVERWELRSNVYVPITSSQTFANTITNPRFVGNQLIYSQYVDQGKSMTGVDFEVGYNLPVMEPHRLRIFAGYYHFEGGPIGAINGVRARAEAVINNTATANVLYTNDPLYGSCVMAGLQLQLPFGKSHPSTNWNRPTPTPFRFVERNYNVIIDHQQTYSGNVVAINPLTSQPYNIEQVSSSGSPSGNGTSSNPFSTVSAAQSAGADVIFVQGNSVLNQAVTLTPGQRLIGDGSSESLPLSGGRTVVLPNLIAAAQTPEFSGVSGTAVTLASNSEVAGFNFLNINGDAIAGNNVANGIIRDVSFTTISGDAIAVSNSSGNFSLNNVTINSATGDGVRFDGGSSNLTFIGSVSGTLGDGISISSMSGGSVGIGGTTISSTTGSGLLLNGVAENVNVASLSTSNTQGPAVSIIGGASTDTYHFTGITNIQTPNGIGFSVNNAGATIVVDSLTVNSTAGSDAISLTNSTGPITLTALNVDTTNATGLSASGLTTLTVTNGTITTVNAPAIDIQTTTMGINLTQVSTNGGPYGITLLQDVGTFTITGVNAAGTGGTIQNTTTGVILNQAGSVSITWMDLTSNGTGIQSQGNNSVTLNDLVFTNSTGYAITSLDDSTMMVENSTFNGNGSTTGGTILGQVDTVASYQWLVQGNVINDSYGTAIKLLTEPNGAGASLGATVQSNTISGSGGSGSLVNMTWNGPLSASVSSNTLNASAGSMTAILINDQSTTATAVVNVGGNTMTFADIQGVGLSFTAAGSNDSQIDKNAVTFNGVQGTGFYFNLTGTATAWIYTNNITDNAGGATGMQFDNVASNSRVQIENNAISLLSTDLTVHRGIIFTDITPTIQFVSNYNNVISNATPSDTFSIPVNSSTGELLINGQMVP